MLTDIYNDLVDVKAGLVNARSTMLSGDSSRTLQSAIDRIDAALNLLTVAFDEEDTYLNNIISSGI